MKRINWQTTRLILIFFVMIFLYSFSLKRNNIRKINKIDISFESDQNLFLTHEMVNNLLIQSLGGTSTIQKDKLDLNTLEKVLNNHEKIDKADVFSTIEGVIHARITQKNPVVRVISVSEDYYIDSKGSRMSLSENFSARVPLVFGEINKDNTKKYLDLFNQIKNDDFLRKNITAIEILHSGNTILTIRNYDFKIEFGKPINVEKKFKNYKAFFHYASKDTLINKYKKINLMFSQQVVCKK